MTAIEQKQHVIRQHANKQIPMKPNIIGLPQRQTQHALQQKYQQHQKQQQALKDQHMSPSLRSSQTRNRAPSNESSLTSPFYRMNSPISPTTPIQMSNIPSLPGSSSNTAFSSMTSLRKVM